METLRISIIQAFLEWGNVKKNLDYFTQEIAKIQGTTDLIILPEMFATGFITNNSDISEDMNGSIMEWLRVSSAKYNVVITGSIAIRENNQFYNRLIWMRQDGSFEKYDKRHLFRMGNEHLNFTQGKNDIVVELKGWRIKPLICYDLRFPVWSKNRLINGKHEYDILIYVANWPASRNHAWLTLLSARAIENQAYCIGVNRIGNDGKGIPHCGGSLILDPKGKAIAACNDNKAETITYTLDDKAINLFREQFKVALDWDEFTISN